MSDRQDPHWLGDINEAITRIEQYTKGFSYQTFLADTKTQDAVVRNLQIIGEAAKNISAEFKRQHRDIDWKAISGMRDKLVHQYFGVNWDILWDVVANKLPHLKTQMPRERNS